MARLPVKLPYSPGRLRARQLPRSEARLKQGVARCRQHPAMHPKKWPLAPESKSGEHTTPSVFTIRRIEEEGRAAVSREARFEQDLRRLARISDKRPQVIAHVSATPEQVRAQPSTRFEHARVLRCLVCESAEQRLTRGAEDMTIASTAASLSRASFAENRLFW